MAYSSSRFQVDIYNDGATEVSVRRGSVYVQGRKGRIQIDAGTLLSMDSNRNAELSALRPEDAWISWNLSRDSSLAQAGDSRRYLPASLDVYSSDFDAFGHWVNPADYDYVWAPVGVVVDWAPYRVGRWCWIGGDYVWCPMNHGAGFRTIMDVGHLFGIPAGVGYHPHQRLSIGALVL